VCEKVKKVTSIVKETVNHRKRWRNHSNRLDEDMQPKIAQDIQL